VRVSVSRKGATCQGGRKAAFGLSGTRGLILGQRGRSVADADFEILGETVSPASEPQHFGGRQREPFLVSLADLLTR